MSSLDWQVTRLKKFLVNNLVDHPDILAYQQALKNAKGILFVTILKGAFLFSGQLGYGLFIKKLGERQWSGPISIMLLGAGIGLQIGVEKTEFIVVISSDRAVNMFESHGQLRLGSEYCLTIGPGIDARGDVVVNRKGVTGEGSISSSEGIFLGFSVESALLVSNPYVNHAYYGTKHAGLKNILRGRIPIPSDKLYHLMDTLATLHEITHGTSVTMLSDGLFFDNMMYNEFQEQQRMQKEDSKILPVTSFVDDDNDNSEKERCR